MIIQFKNDFNINDYVWYIYPENLKIQKGRLMNFTFFHQEIASITNIILTVFLTNIGKMFSKSLVKKTYEVYLETTKPSELTPLIPNHTLGCKIERSTWTIPDIYVTKSEEDAFERRNMIFDIMYWLPTIRNEDVIVNLETFYDYRSKSLLESLK